MCTFEDTGWRRGTPSPVLHPKSILKGYCSVQLSLLSGHRTRFLAYSITAHLIISWTVWYEPFCRLDPDYFSNPFANDNQQYLCPQAARNTMHFMLIYTLTVHHCNRNIAIGDDASLSDLVGRWTRMHWPPILHCSPWLMCMYLISVSSDGCNMLRSDRWRNSRH